MNADLKRRTLDAREDIEKTISLFYTKYIPPGYDGNLTAYARKRLNADELRELGMKDGQQMVKLLGKGGAISRLDLLKAQTEEIAETYADSFRVTNKAVPESMRSRLDTDIDAFSTNAVNELHAAVCSGFIKGHEALRMNETMAGIFNRHAGKLTGNVASHYEHIEAYLLLKGYEAAGYVRFRFVVDEKDTTCGACLSHSGAVYTTEELAASGAFPPLHPHCGCYLATMDGAKIDAKSFAPGEDGSSAAHWYDALLRMPQDAGEIGTAFWTSQLGRYDNIDQGVLAFLDWCTYGIISGMIEANAERTRAVQNDPNLYNISNWLSVGTVDLFDGALFPDEPLSLEHLLDSLGAAGAIIGGYYAARKALVVREPVSLPYRDVGAATGAFEGAGRTTAADWTGKTNDLAKTSPMRIPENAAIKIGTKAAGYDQISYKWSAGVYKYEARWHTKTPGAPMGQGNTWVVERITPGTTTGQMRVTHIKVGETWVTRTAWQDAIKAYQNGTLTAVQEALLKYGHWPAP